jgi:UDP:flavonoid glycosyltransferase YjiC (YdhE family)
VVIDAIFSAALAVAPRFGCPTVVMVHTFFDRLIDGWRADFAMQSGSRERAGFDPLPALPVLLPWDDDDRTPIVLLSFSTVPEQRSPVMVQRALDALASLPVHVVATTKEIVDPSELAAPANAFLVPFADHDALMGRASMVVGHGGHGTTMRALSHGLPIVGIPAKGADQVPITQLLEEWGVGRALSADAGIEEIRTTAESVLRDPDYLDAARRRARALTGNDGAHLAADSIERAVATRPG